MNHENAIYYCITRVEPNYGPFYMQAAPSTTYEGIVIDPSSGLSGLLHLVERRTHLMVYVVLMTDRLFWLERPFSVRLLETPHILPHVRNALYFRLL